MSKVNLTLVLGIFLGLLAPRLIAQEKTSNSWQDGTSTAGDRPALEKREWRYQLHPGDMLEVTFPFTPEFNQVVTVQPDGYVTLRGLGDVRIEGQTLPQLRQLLQTAYRNIVSEQMITVELKDFEKPYFIVDGEVGHPGKFELHGESTVAQALAIAGGIKDTAKHSQILLFRRVSDHWVSATKINLKEMLAQGNLREDPYLRPGDMLYVPKNAISKIKPYLPVPSLGTYFPIP